MYYHITYENRVADQITTHETGVVYSHFTSADPMIGAVTISIRSRCEPMTREFIYEAGKCKNKTYGPQKRRKGKVVKW